MHSDQLANKTTTHSTQGYLDILEIKDDLVVLKDGTIRAAALVSSINFALKSEEEQQAVIQGYVQFLNSFDFTMQIVIQSRKLRIDEYLEHLKQMEKEQTNDLLRIQTAEYREFVTELVDIADIMSKRFYIVVPYEAVQKKRKNFFTRSRDVLSPGRVIKLREEKFQKYKEELDKRMGFVIESLGSLGLKAVRLDTQSLMELYYTTYNPDTAPQQDLANINELNIEHD